MLRLGVDLGGTKIEIVALYPDGSERVRRRIPSPQQDYAATIHAIKSLVCAVEAELGEQGTVGICTPGSRSRVNGRMRNANSTCLNGQMLLSDLSALLEREIRIENDANCFALSEAIDGAGLGAQTVFGVILGTGVGGGVVSQGTFCPVRMP